ncbi:hypothetical protein D3C76_837320 [compost metagenome]
MDACRTTRGLELLVHRRGANFELQDVGGQRSGVWNERSGKHAVLADLVDRLAPDCVSHTHALYRKPEHHDLDQRVTMPERQQQCAARSGAEGNPDVAHLPAEDLTILSGVHGAFDRGVGDEKHSQEHHCSAEHRHHASKHVFGFATLHVSTGVNGADDRAEDFLQEVDRCITWRWGELVQSA